MRILVVDDHEVVRRGICSVLATESSLTLCGEAVDGRDAVEKALSLRPDIVVMDITMPQMNGLEATREIKRVLPRAEIVIVSQHEGPEMVRQAFNAGARAYVVKSSIAKDLLAAIAKVNDGESFVKGAATAGPKQGLDPQEVLQRSAATEKALRESEERFRSAMNNMAEGLCMIDVQGRITYMNRSAEILFGWDAADLLGKNIHDATHYKYPDGTAFPAADCSLLQVLKNGTELRDHQDTFIRKDGAMFPVVCSASPLNVDGSLAGLVLGFRDVSKRGQTEVSLQQSEAEKQLNLVVETLESRILERTAALLLHPPLLDEVGLDSALRWYVEGFSERSKISVTLQLEPGFTEGLPRDLALCVFRLVQECLTNIHRHSESPNALVTIKRTADELILLVQDDGIGIPSEIQSKILSGQSPGVGLRGMRERIRQFGGRLEVHSGAGSTQIIATLPTPPLPITSAAKKDSQSAESADAILGRDGTVQPRATILCIDDEATGLLARKLLLESSGYRVIEARSGPDGIARFRSEKVDLVILDYWMSGMKGTTVAAELRSINPATPIIVLSGMSDLPGEAAGLVDRWLLKGSHRAEELLHSINTLLERRTV